MKFGIIGANGQFGSDLCRVFVAGGHGIIPVNHADLDIGDGTAVAVFFGRLGLDAVVNTAAFHQVDLCEQTPEKAFQINGLGARNLALAARETGFKLVHISTDYVFDGLKQVPYLETDTPRPLNVYGNTKLSGEHFVEAIAPKHFVVRVSGLYGKEPCRAKGGANFVRTMLRLARERGKVKVVTDEIVSPTYTFDAAGQILQLIETDHYGLYHCTPQGCCSWHEFAGAIFRLSQTAVELLPAVAADFPAKTPRPAYSVLDNARLRAYGLDIMPHWEESLRRYLAEIGELKLG